MGHLGLKYSVRQQIHVAMDEMYGITQPAKYKLWVIDKIYKIDDE